MLVLSTITLPVTTGSAKANTLQMSSDSSSTGWYPNESRLSPEKVRDGTFGEVFDTQIDGAVYAQPLVSQETVLAVTEKDYAYGLNAKTGAIAWQDGFGPAADPLAQIGCGDVGSSVGVTGTPVIDTSTGIAYFVAARGTGPAGATQWFMEAVKVRDGAPAPNWPPGGVEIQGSADNDAATVFDAQYEMQRPGLVLVDGVVYAAFGSQCDYGNWEGWVIGVGESSATITTMWSTEEHVPDTGFEQPGGGIWQSGSPPVVDTHGDIFVVTGNGDIPPEPTPSGDPNADAYGEAVVELSTSGGILHPINFFIAADAVALNGQDGDLGSGGPVALPLSMGTKKEPHVMLVDGKQGILYVLNQDHLGGFQQGPNGTDDVPSEVGPYGGVWSKPAVWPGNGGYVYLPTAGTVGFASSGGSLVVLSRSVNSKGTVSFKLAGSTARNLDTFGYGSGTPIVTSNGLKSGTALVWVIHAIGPSGVDSQLQAYRPVPTKGLLDEVWNSAPFTSTVFSEPTADNSVIYVGTDDDSLLGFGALGSESHALRGSDLNFAATTVSQSVTTNAIFTATSPTTLHSFTVSGAYALGAPSISLPARISTGESITVPVTFTPTALGTNAGILTANIAGATSAISLTGEGGTAATSFDITPEEAVFPPQKIGGRPASPISVTFTNVSSDSINVTGFESPASPFSVIDPPADQTVPPGGSLIYTVEYYPPISSGDFDHLFSNVATLETNVGNFGVAITGSANPPADISTVPVSLNFGRVAVGSAAVLHFDLGDQGGFPLKIIRSTPPTTDGFSALTNPFSQLAKTNPARTIAPNTSLQETVRFAPKKVGKVSAMWLLEGNDGNRPQKLIFTGSGYSAG